jgi:predicted neuraminidase
MRFSSNGILLAAIGFGVLLAPLAIAETALVKSELIFEQAPFPQCHASTIVETRRGLVAAWFGGTREKNADVGIWLSRLEDGRWTTPVEVATGRESSTRYPCWNPVLFQPKDGPLLLFYKVGPNPDKWWGMLMQSADSGRNWAPAKRLPDGILGPIKNKPVQLSNGDLICPTSTEDKGWQAHFERTTDLGITWQKRGAVNDGKKIGAIQPAILQLGNNRLAAVGRTEQGRIFRIESPDHGRSWEEMKLTELPNPNSGIDAVTLKNGTHVLVYNHTARGRSPLNVAVSSDSLAWQGALVLENGAGEYSYPAVIQSSDGMLHITYTWKRQRIKHLVIDPARLNGKAIVNGIWPELDDQR